MVSFVGAFLLWSALAYFNHWFVHSKWAPKWLAAIHQLHHDKHYPMPKNFDWHTLLFYFGSWKETFGVVAGITLPCVFACIVFDNYWLLLVHYIYESIFADNLIEHNRKIGSFWAMTFGVGRYHLKHHTDPTVNFAVGLAWWDYLCKTQRRVH